MALTTTVGKHTTFDSLFLDDTVKGIAALVEPRITVTLDLIPEGEPVETTKIKWYDAVTNSLEGAVRATGWNISDTTGLPITDATAAIINIGDVIRVEDEYMVVSAVVRTTGAATISVHARGHGGSTAATHAATTVIYITGSAHVEGTVDGDSIIEDNIEKVNYTQILEETLEISITSKNARNEDVANKLDEARVKALSRALRKLNMSALMGVPSIGSATTPRSAGGLRHFITDSADNINVDASASFSETVLRDTLVTIAKRGGTPNMIICSPEVKSTINGFNRSSSNTGLQTRVDRQERTAGTIVDFYEGEGVGTIAIVADPLLRSAFDEMFIINTNKMEKAWFSEDMLRYATEPANSRVQKETLQGQLTFKFKDVATDFARIHTL